MNGDVEWDLRKATANLKKHGVDFADAATVFHDEQAVTIREDAEGEERLHHHRHGRAGRRARCRVHVAWRSTTPDIRSQGRAEGVRAVRKQIMKAHYDFSHGKRGPVLKAPPGKTRITIRIDDDLIEWFRKQVHAAGGGSYQTLINAALREYVQAKREPLEATLRRVLREELPRDLKRVAGR